jgi:hypothetical protein
MLKSHVVTGRLAPYRFKFNPKADSSCENRAFCGVLNGQECPFYLLGAVGRTIPGRLSFSGALAPVLTYNLPSFLIFAG